jgi:uncharacterized protein YqhQ
LADSEVYPLNDKITYGGQAVIEGVMMRSPRFFSVACRRRDGEIFVRTEPVPAFFTRYQWARWPFMRGVFALADAMVLGMKALLWSANIAAEDDRVQGLGVRGQGSEGSPDGSVLTPDPSLLTPELLTPNPSRTDTVSGLVVSGSVFLGLGIGIVLFVLTPSLLIGWVPRVGNALARNLLEGTLRVGMFLGYIALISRMAHVKRLFGYHGAEHKAINGLELTGLADVEAARLQSTIHPRCGTNFVLTVLMVKVLLASFFGWPVWWLRLLIRLAMLPATAALAFEVIRLAGKYRDVQWLQWIVAPGLWTQRLTTREPDTSMLEVAVQSLQSVMEREQATPGLLVSPQPTTVS